MSWAVKLASSALILVLAACGPEAGTDQALLESPEVDLQEPLSVELVERGREVFLGEGGCHICHGPEGRGARGVGANLRDRVWWHSDGSYPALVRRIAEGVPRSEARNIFSAAMPPRGGSDISDADLRAVAAYVWSFRTREDTVPEPVEATRR
ncbi:MAG: cytochrome c [Gemmatimonadota bacterium]